ncbi:MAG: hypothetical protein IT445_02005 [Phycisphaeraceae bacterium]|nr:hypothetical protein [Phycisphaeraceae bacterium]
MMSAGNPSHVEVVLRDIACPGCQYNLRGLYGPIVQCPECGLACDIARLVSLRWTKPWHRAPKFNHVCLAVTWAAMTPIMLAVVVIVEAAMRMRTMSPAPFWAVGMLMFAGWLWSLWLAYRVFDTWRGVWLGLLAHAIFATYLATTFIMLSAGINMVMFFASQWVSNTALVVYLILLGVLLPLSFLGRLGEKWIARQCIAEYLRRRGADVGNSARYASEAQPGRLQSGL